jgi:hypothetical protein
METYLVVLYTVFFLVMLFKLQMAKIKGSWYPYGLIKSDNLPEYTI